MIDVRFRLTLQLRCEWCCDLLRRLLGSVLRKGCGARALLVPAPDRCGAAEIPIAFRRHAAVIGILFVFFSNAMRLRFTRGQ